MTLLLLHSLTQNASALRHRVRTLQLRCFNAMRCRSEASEVSAEAPWPRADVAAVESDHRGLRGMSVAEVLRKGWHRWHFAVSFGEWRPLCRRPENVAELLQSLNEEIHVALLVDASWWMTTATLMQKMTLMKAPKSQQSRVDCFFALLLDEPCHRRRRWSFQTHA